MTATSRIIDELRSKNPDIVIGGSSHFNFSLEEFHILYEGEILSVWDPLSQPIGKRRGNFVILVDNTYFATIAYHLIQHAFVENQHELDVSWASVGVMKKVIAECMYLRWPCRTAIALMIEYLMEFEMINIKINKVIRENYESVKLIGLISRACTASSSYHELGHFLYANENFRYEYFSDIDSLDTFQVPNTDPAEMREEVFCDSLGLYMTVSELIREGYHWTDSFELAKASLYGSHMTLLCQQLAYSNLSLNEPQSGAKEKDVSLKISELDFRFEAAVDHAHTKLASDFIVVKVIDLPIVFSKKRFTLAIQEASELPCRDLGIRRISSLLSDAFVRSDPKAFGFVVNNAHQFTKTGHLHSFNYLKT